MERTGTSKRAFVLLMLLAVIGGGTAVFGKIALREIPPFSFTALRFLMTTLILVLWNTGNRSSTTPSIAPNHQRAAHLIPLFLTGNVVLFAFGIRWIGATISQVMYAVAPIVIAILSQHFLQQRITRNAALGILIGLVGVLTVLLPDNEGTILSYLGPLLIGCAVLSFSTYSVFSKKYLASALLPETLSSCFRGQQRLLRPSSRGRISGCTRNGGVTYRVRRLQHFCL